MLRRWAGWLIYCALLALWIATWLPLLPWLVLAGVIPLLPPHFDSASTVEGVIIWMAFATWLYVAPFVFYGFRRFSKIPWHN